MTSTSSIRKTVAVAADTPFVRDRFKTALDAAGHRAMVVKSVAQLLAHVRADFDDLDLIVLDLRMPHASGVELVKRIRKLDGGKLPILVFSGSVSSVDEVRELAALGVAGYLNEYSAVEHILPSIAPHLFPGHVQPARAPARRDGHSRFVPDRQDHCRGAGAEPEPRRHGDPHQQAAGARHRAEGEVRAAGLEARARSGRRGLLERSEGRHGHAVHESEAGRSGGRSTASSKRTSSAR